MCPPPSRLVGLLVENQSLYATYGKQFGQFVDNPHADNWHNTWQLAVTLAEAMSRHNSIVEPADQDSPEVARKDSLLARLVIHTVTKPRTTPSIIDTVILLH